MDASKKKSKEKGPDKPKGKHGGKRISNKPICGALSRSTGKPCPRVAGFGTDHKGSGRCSNHGGLTPVKHGLYSSVIPTEYQELYEQLRNAPNMNSLMDELAFLRITLVRLQKKYGDREGVVTMGELFVEPLQMIADTIEQISRVVKRKNDMEEGTKISFTLTDLKDFSEAMMQAVVKHVSNPDTIAAIRLELATYFAGQAPASGV